MKNDCVGCTGYSQKCEQECMMEASVKDIEYFEDEELDMYKGRASSDYSDDEAEEFRYVLETMRQDEVADWNRSLRLREINVPDQIKDELTLLLQS